MKRALSWLVLIVVLVISCTALHRALPQKKGSSDYTKWEEQCIKEYEENDVTFIYIDVTQKKLYLFKDRELIKKYPIATGTADTPTPLGVYRIISKGAWGEGFGGHWMGLNVPWGKYGIHGTNKPGSIGFAASHGCIRMKSRDAEDLYKRVKYGTVVEIYGGPFGAFGKGLRELKPGDRGSDVMELQRVLKSKGYYKGHVDGHYGLSTERALYSFEADNRLPMANKVTRELYRKIGIVLVD